MHDEGDARIRATFGDNYPRLADLKAKYDLRNLFQITLRPCLEPGACAS